jgi:hypothetical protein
MVFVIARQSPDAIVAEELGFIQHFLQNAAQLMAINDRHHRAILHTALARIVNSGEQFRMLLY